MGSCQHAVVCACNCLCTYGAPTELLQAAPPVDAATAAQQVTTSLLINLPLALSAGISFPQAAVDRRVEPLDVTPELAATLIEGKQLWQQQASHTDALQCSPFNGPADLLRQAAAAPIVGAQSAPSKEQMAAAGAAFAAAAKAVAMQSAAAKRSHANSSSIRGFGPLQAFRKAVIVPTDPSLAPTDNLVPSQSADATASVTWDGSNSITVGVTPGAGMDATAAHTSGEALQDGMRNMVPWMQLKVRCGLVCVLFRLKSHVLSTHDCMPTTAVHLCIVHPIAGRIVSNAAAAAAAAASAHSASSHNARRQHCHAPQHDVRPQRAQRDLQCSAGTNNRPHPLARHAAAVNSALPDRHLWAES